MFYNIKHNQYLKKGNEIKFNFIDDKLKNASSNYLNKGDKFQNYESSIENDDIIYELNYDSDNNNKYELISGLIFH